MKKRTEKYLNEVIFSMDILQGNHTEKDKKDAFRNLVLNLDDIRGQGEAILTTENIQL